MMEKLRVHYKINGVGIEADCWADAYVMYQDYMAEHHGADYDVEIETIESKIIECNGE